MMECWTPAHVVWLALWAVITDAKAASLHVMIITGIIFYTGVQLIVLARYLLLGVPKP